MVASASDITFLVPGQAEAGAKGLSRGPALPAPEVQGKVKASVRVSAQRAAGEVVRISARPDDDIVVLHIANGPTLYLHPENARELLRAQVGGGGQAARGAVEPSIGADVKVPVRLSWRGLEPTVATRGGEPSGIGGAFLDASRSSPTSSRTPRETF